MPEKNSEKTPTTSEKHVEPAKSEKKPVNAAPMTKDMDVIKKTKPEPDPKIEALEQELSDLKSILLAQMEEKEKEDLKTVQVYDCSKKQLKAEPVRATMNVGGRFIRD